MYFFYSSNAPLPTMEEISEWNAQLKTHCENYEAAEMDYYEALLKDDTPKTILQMKWVLSNVNHNLVFIDIHYAVMKKITEEKIRMIENLPNNLENEERRRSMEEMIRQYEHFGKYAWFSFQELRANLKQKRMDHLLVAVLRDVMEHSRM